MMPINANCNENEKGRTTVKVQTSEAEVPPAPWRDLPREKKKKKSILTSGTIT